MMSNYSKFIHCSRYARWLPEEGRRETWEETVGRYIDFFQLRFDFNDSVLETELRDAILEMKVCPSMRALMCAGEALRRDNVAGYNCSYVAVDHPRVFDEIMYILMCGAGVGFSVERDSVSQLPMVPDKLWPKGETLLVRDSKIGWCEAYKKLIYGLYSGDIYGWDVSKVRPSGSPLKTFGGRASGPEPLVSLFEFTVELFNKAKGRKLTTLECHDLVCKVADIVVVGGVRRSALISLSNLSDDRVRGCKSGQWWIDNPQRALANNSACYTVKPDFDSFLKEWVSLYESKSGERGIFSRTASQNQAARSGRRETNHEFGTNPCSEIILRNAQFCNLTEVVVRAGDTFDDLKEKVRQATVLGTLQSSLTDFRHLRKIWSDNTKEERLLGVSLTGIMDHLVLSGQDTYSQSCKWYGTNVTLESRRPWKAEHQVLERVLEELKNVAIKTNKEWANKLGIPSSTAVTCVKPSGTVSQLVDSASGIHSRFSPYYIRRVRADTKDPLTQLMSDQGVPNEPCKMKPDSTVIFSFPQKAPEGAHCVKDDTALQQLELWKIYQDHWCEHKPSITVYYGDDEFLDVGGWIYKNFDKVSGVSFLPRSEHTYEQAPYEEITEEEYEGLQALMPVIDWGRLGEYEKEDQTKGTQTLACSAGVCELVDI